MTLFIFVLSFYSNKNHTAVISNFELLYETPIGYVYKAKLIADKFFSKNFLYEYSDEPLSLENKPDYIKNYGASIEIRGIPDVDYDKNATFDITNNCIVFSNSANINIYKYNLYTSHNEEYAIEIKAKTREANTNSQKIYYRLNYIDGYSPIKNTENISTNWNIFTDIKTINTYSENTYDNIDFVFPRGIVDVEYIKISQISDKLYLKMLSNNIIITSYDKLEYNEEINDVSYKLNINFNLYVILFFMIVALLTLILSFFYYEKISLLFNNKRIFVCTIIVTGIILFIFHYWLCFPGYMYYGDNIGSMIEGITGVSSNWFPVIISKFLGLMYKLFGYHTYYLFLLNLLLYYSGITLIILGIYLKYNKKRSILLFLITFIAPIFLVIINHAKDITATMFAWFSFCLIFFTILLNDKKLKLKIILYIISVIFIIIGMLWRHNMIVTVYPVFIAIVYDILKYKKLKPIKYILTFISIMLLISIFLILIYKEVPNLLIDKDKLSKGQTAHLFLLQIAGCAVPANDGSMIPESWYNDGKNFEDIKKLYNDNPYWGDLYVFSWYGNEAIFKFPDNSELKKVWIKYILKYPFNYLKHSINYLKNILTVKTWKESVYNVQYKVDYFWYDVHKYYFGNIYDNDGITFSKIKYKIYSLLFVILPDILTVYFSILSILLFFITMFIIINNRFINNILIFIFSISFSSFATTLITSFTPSVLYRYVYPITPISIILLISLILFIYDKNIKRIR